ncbi:MAG: hypothetical protein GY729_01645 [Desulfobacteraceae bacterium]|nr:hypothetical protein [Desulfobacteraceae bacterium]
MKKKTFSLTNSQLDLGSIKAYTPIPMIYPGLNPVCLDDPKVISKGVAAIGTISNQLFFAGRTLEQALAINVKGKGIVLIVGCGHQTLSRILERTESLFNQPVYGIIGGLHYPVESSRLILHGFPVQKYIGTGKLPWESITIKDVKQNIGLLKSKNPKLVGLSAHDSCDLSLAEFRRSFAKAYCQIKAGKPIKV